MARPLWIGVVAAMVLLVVMLFSAAGTISSTIASLLLLVDAVLLLGIVLWESIWPVEIVLLFILSIFLFVAVFDKLVIDIYADVLNLVYVLFLGIAAFVLVRSEGVIGRVSPSAVIAVPTVKISGKEKVPNPVLYGSVKKGIVSVRKVKLIPSRERRRFIMYHFPRRVIVAPEFKMASPAEMEQSVPIQEFSRLPSFLQEEERVRNVFQNLFVEPERLTVQTTPAEEPDHGDQSLDVFLVSTNGERFHLPSCMIAKRIPPEKKVVFTNPVDVVKEGFVPCGVCNPLKR